MTDNICPNCKSRINANVNFCKNCGFPLNNQKISVDKFKNDLITLKGDIINKFQNRLENEDIIKVEDVNEIIKNLDEISLNKLLDKYGISQGKLKLVNINKLLDKVDINRLKEDLRDFHINSQSSKDSKNIKFKIINGEDVNVSQDNKTSFENREDEVKYNDNVNQDKHIKEEYGSNSDICKKCGFKNRSKVKFCTNCGNKLI